MPSRTYIFNEKFARFLLSIRLIYKGVNNVRNNRLYVNDYEDVLSIIPSYLFIWTGFWNVTHSRVTHSRVQIPGNQNRNQFSITSGQGWLRPMLSTGKWVKKIVSFGRVFDLAVEQSQLFRKLSQNKQTKHGMWVTFTLTCVR